MSPITKHSLTSISRTVYQLQKPFLHRRTLASVVMPYIEDQAEIRKRRSIHAVLMRCHVYAKNVLRMENPRVGLLSIGEEDSKGNTLTRDTLPLLRELPLNFLGNVEGRDVFNGNADVIVCDGFVGNCVLKSAEGTAKMLTSILRDSLKSTVTSQVGALLSRKAFSVLKKRLDYTEYGGAPLLGVRGPAIIGHGSSNDRAIMNGIRVAAELARAEVSPAIEAALSGRNA